MQRILSVITFASLSVFVEGDRARALTPSDFYISGWWYSDFNVDTASCQGEYLPIDGIPFDVSGSTCFVNPTNALVKSTVFWVEPPESPDEDAVYIRSVEIQEEFKSQYFPAFFDSSGIASCDTIQSLKDELALNTTLPQGVVASNREKIPLFNTTCTFLYACDVNDPCVMPVSVQDIRTLSGESDVGGDDFDFDDFDFGDGSDFGGDPAGEEHMGDMVDNFLGGIFSSFEDKARVITRLWMCAGTLVLSLWLL